MKVIMVKRKKKSSPFINAARNFQEKKTDWGKDHGISPDLSLGKILNFWLLIFC